MTAVVLRRAATLIRERAQAATGGPWVARQEHGRDYTDEGWSYVAVTSASATDVAATAYPGGSESDLAIEDSLHIASWHPVVALAVADWLEETADEFEETFGVRATEEDMDLHRPAALAVARVYLGAES